MTFHKYKIKHSQCWDREAHESPEIIDTKSPIKFGIRSALGCSKGNGTVDRLNKILHGSSMITFNCCFIKGLIYYQAINIRGSYKI